VLVPYGDHDALAEAVVRVLTDIPYQQELRRRSVNAHQMYFAWDKIAEQYCEVLYNA
jgi:glycosyltransferase involved in cell wall biosynthesis